MEFNKYQAHAARTINDELTVPEMRLHALHLMVSEVGEIHGIYQKAYQGHNVDETELKKEVGDLLWGIAEFCTSHGWMLDEIACMNVEKLRKRYPDGFEASRSVNREEYKSGATVLPLEKVLELHHAESGTRLYWVDKYGTNGWRSVAELIHELNMDNDDIRNQIRAVYGSKYLLFTDKPTPEEIAAIDWRE